MRESVDERLIRLWASPQGAPKAALAGAGIDPLKVFRNPGGLLQEGTAKIGNTSVTWDGNTPVVTFPIPGVDDATAVARLDDRFMTQSVVVTQGRTTYEFTYSDYDDHNNPLNLIEVYTPGRMVESRNGQVVRDVNTVVTETGSVYVVVPVPSNVGPTQPLPMFGSDQQPPGSIPPLRRRVWRAASPTSPAPGKPRQKFFIWRYGNRRCAPTQLDGCSPAWNQTVDFEFEAASRFGPNRPIYKPEHWDKVVYLDMWTNRLDPIMTCQPMGQPRQGPPGRIFATDNDITLLYGRGGDGGGGYSDFRVIPTDGRAFDPTADPPDQVHGSFRRPLGRRHTRDRVGRVHAGDLARARRVLSLRGHEGLRALHAQGRSDALRGDGRGPASAAPALEAEPDAADHRDWWTWRWRWRWRRRRVAWRRARRLPGRRARRHLESDSPLEFAQSSAGRRPDVRRLAFRPAHGAKSGFSGK